MILVVDNYDSFTWNLVQYLGELGSDPVVWRNDEISLAAIRRMKPERIVISPGPGRPEDAGISCRVVAEFQRKVPILGVCLGHQCLAHVNGASVVRDHHVGAEDAAPAPPAVPEGEERVDGPANAVLLVQPQPEQCLKGDG